MFEDVRKMMMQSGCYQEKEQNKKDDYTSRNISLVFLLGMRKKKKGVYSVCKQFCRKMFSWCSTTLYIELIKFLRFFIEIGY